jgi:hypothetical protein
MIAITIAPLMAPSAAIVDPVAIARIIIAIVPAIARRAVIIVIVAAAVAATDHPVATAIAAIIVIGAAAEREGRSQREARDRHLAGNTHYFLQSRSWVVGGINARNG